MIASTARPHKVGRSPDVVAVGTPSLAVADEARELVEDLIAELLLARLEAEEHAQ